MSVRYYLGQITHVPPGARTVGRNYVAALEPQGARGGSFTNGDVWRIFDPPLNALGVHRHGWVVIEIDAPDHTLYRADARLRNLPDRDPDTLVSAIAPATRQTISDRMIEAGLDPSPIRLSDTLLDVFRLMREQIRERVST